eukprot:scaffold297_cov386-Prasinococcus_capsulatus_cf.AAC.10
MSRQSSSAQVVSLRRTLMTLQGMGRLQVALSSAARSSPDASRSTRPEQGARERLDAGVAERSGEMRRPLPSRAARAILPLASALDRPRTAPRADDAECPPPVALCS